MTPSHTATLRETSSTLCWIEEDSIYLQIRKSTPVIHLYRPLSLSLIKTGSVNRIYKATLYLMMKNRCSIVNRQINPSELWTSTVAPHYSRFECDHQHAASLKLLFLSQKASEACSANSCFSVRELCRVQAEAGVYSGSLGCLYQLNRDKQTTKCFV